MQLPNFTAGHALGRAAQSSITGASGRGEVVAWFALSSDSTGNVFVRTKRGCHQTIEPGGMKFCHVPAHPRFTRYTANCTDGGSFSGSVARGQFVNLRCKAPETEE